MLYYIFEKVAKFDTQSPDAYKKLGNLFLIANFMKAEQAMLCYQKAIEVDPEDVKAYQFIV